MQCCSCRALEASHRLFDEPEFKVLQRMTAFKVPHDRSELKLGERRTHRVVDCKIAASCYGCSRLGSSSSLIVCATEPAQLVHASQLHKGTRHSMQSSSQHVGRLDGEARRARLPVTCRYAHGVPVFVIAERWSRHCQQCDLSKFGV